MRFLSHAIIYRNGRRHHAWWCPVLRLKSRLEHCPRCRHHECPDAGRAGEVRYAGHLFTPEARARAHQKRLAWVQQQARFTDKEIRAMRQARADGATLQDIADAYDVGRYMIRRIVNRRAYKWVD